MFHEGCVFTGADLQVILVILVLNGIIFRCVIYSVNVSTCKWLLNEKF